MPEEKLSIVSLEPGHAVIRDAVSPEFFIHVVPSHSCLKISGGEGESTYFLDATGARALRQVIDKFLTYHEGEEIGDVP